MKTFILVHGSWHGAWNWHLVSPLLERAGHRVICVDLPGMGRNKTPIKDVKMADTVDYLCELVLSLDGKVILLGHSKNGIMISQVAEQIPQKIEKLVYLAAYLLPNGKTQREYSAMDTEGVLKPYVRFDSETNSTTLEEAIYKEGLYADCPEYITSLAKVLLSAEPVESAITPLQITEQRYGRVPRVYIECTEDRAVTPFLQQKMYGEMPCEQVFQLKSSHSPFFSMPEKLAEILLHL